MKDAIDAIGLDPFWWFLIIIIVGSGVKEVVKHAIDFVNTVHERRHERQLAAINVPLEVERIQLERVEEESRLLDRKLESGRNSEPKED